MQQHVVEHPPRHAAHAVGDPDRAVRRGARPPPAALVGRPAHARRDARGRRGSAPTAPRARPRARRPTAAGGAPASPAGSSMRRTHSLLLRAREPRRDGDDRALALAPRADRAHALARPADLDLRRVVTWAAHRHASAQRPRPAPDSTRRHPARPAEIGRPGRVRAARAVDARGRWCDTTTSGRRPADPRSGARHRGRTTWPRRMQASSTA